MGVPTEPVRFQSSKLRYALSGRLYFCSFAGLFCILRKFLLHGFVAFELLQKIVVAPRDWLLHRFFIGTTQLLSDCFSNGLERNKRLVWQVSHLDQCLESNIVPERTLVSKNPSGYLRPVRSSDRDRGRRHPGRTACDAHAGRPDRCSWNLCARELFSPRALCGG